MGGLCTIPKEKFYKIWDFAKENGSPIQKCGRDKEMLVITGIFVISGSLSIIIPCRPGAKDVIRYTRVCYTGVTLWLI